MAPNLRHARTTSAKKWGTLMNFYSAQAATVDIARRLAARQTGTMESTVAFASPEAQKELSIVSTKCLKCGQACHRIFLNSWVRKRGINSFSFWITAPRKSLCRCSTRILTWMSEWRMGHLPGNMYIISMMILAALLFVINACSN